jgi:hypothetical protein
VKISLAGSVPGATVQFLLQVAHLGEKKNGGLENEVFLIPPRADTEVQALLHIAILLLKFCRS